MKVKVTNTTPVDVYVDTKGNNDPKDKVIIHPSRTESLDILDVVYTNLKNTKGLIVNLAK